MGSIRYIGRVSTKVYEVSAIEKISAHNPAGRIVGRGVEKVINGIDSDL